MYVNHLNRAIYRLHRQ